jgi:cytidine deaminase
MKDEKFELSMRVFESPEEAPASFQSLLNSAKQAMSAAYAPYSKFRVGAAVLLQDGTIVLGSNQENASFPEGLCAERVALYAAGAQYPGNPPIAIAVVADKLDQGWISPCGGCRQVMLEMEQRAGMALQVILTNKMGQMALIPSAATLLPWCFDGHLLDQ